MSGALPSSFRDPAGYVIRENATEKRVVTWRGRDDYEAYMSSGLHDALLQKGRVLPHRDAPAGPLPSGTYRMLVPEKIEYISYPYEWSFDQLKDAALLTLDVQETALRHGMCLKNASAFNVQFRGSSPVFIDCLSFETDRGGPWIAYEPFCRHFLAPLLLMRYGAAAFNKYAIVELSGIPLDVNIASAPLVQPF